MPVGDTSLPVCTHRPKKALLTSLSTADGRERALRNSNRLRERLRHDGSFLCLAALAYHMQALTRAAACRLGACAYHDPGVSAQRHEAVYRLAMDGSG